MASSRKSPSDAAISEALIASLSRQTRAGDCLVVGYSGGIDSTVLLHAVAALAPQLGWTVSALHVNHGLSPHADDWQAHCLGVCAEWCIPCTVQQVAVERGSADGLEAAARRARHAAYAAANADWIVLGHHANDQAETLLFNLLRGCGVAGASGMAEANGRLLRPLLTVAKESIAAYAAARQLRWIDDESNVDCRYSRNHLRHEVLVGLEGRFPGSTGNLVAATQRFAEARMLLDDLACSDLDGAAPEFPLPISVLASLPERRARNVLRYLLRRQQVGIPSEERLREALVQLLTAAPDRHPSIRFGRHVLRRRKGRVLLELQEA